jgi:hypothetical protein
MYATEFKHPYFGWLRLEGSYDTAEEAESHARRESPYPQRAVQLGPRGEVVRVVWRSPRRREGG